MTDVPTLGGQNNTVASPAWSVDFPSVSQLLSLSLKCKKNGDKNPLAFGFIQSIHGIFCGVKNCDKNADVLMKIQSSFVPIK